MLEISKLLSTLLSCPAEDISACTGTKGKFTTEYEADFNCLDVLSCLQSACPVSAPLTPCGQVLCHPVPSQPPPYSLLPLLSGITQAAAAADSGHQHSCHHVTQHQTSPSSAVSIVTEIWELSSALQIKPTLSVSQTTPVRIWRLGCNALLWTLIRFVSNGGGGGGGGALLGPSHFISESFLGGVRGEESS